MRTPTAERPPSPTSWDEAEERPTKRKKKKRPPRWATILIVLGALLLVLSAGGVLAFKLALDKATNSIETVEIPRDDSQIAAGQALKGPINILLVGIDDGQADGGELRTDSARADSIMVLHVPESHDHAYIASLPRDLWVKIPKNPDTKFGGGSGKLNSAYTIGFGDGKCTNCGRIGGLSLLMKTIKQETGLSLNAAATVNFTGFTKAVKLLGGVTMTVDEWVDSVHYGTDKWGNMCTPARFDSAAQASRVKGCEARRYEKGVHRFNAEQALDYTRQREWMELEDGDYGRQRHQQQFIKALAREAKAQGLTTNPGKALTLMETVGSALSMWTNGEKLEDWFFTLKDIAGGDIAMIKTNNGWYNSANVEGTSAEGLSETSKQMFTALANGKITDFLQAHPDWLSKES